MVDRPTARAWLSVLAIVAGAGVGVIGGLLDASCCGPGGVAYVLAAVGLGWTRLPSAPFAAFVILPAHGVVYQATHELRSTASVGMCFGVIAAGGLALVALVGGLASHVEVRTRAPRRVGEP